MAEPDQQQEGIETDLYTQYDETDEASNENHERYFENTEDNGNYEYNVDENDFAAILDQKDKDLRLAAELGKALLEQNAELERRLEQTTEEYTQKLEVAQQEKYGLHLKLENFEIEYDNTVKELQYDIGQLRQELESKSSQTVAGEKEKLVRIRELTQQNERLSEDLQQERQRKEHLSDELQQLKDSTKLTSRQQGHIEVLQDEISSLSSRLGELERHVAIVTEERDNAVCNLDENLDKIKILERQKSEQDAELQKKTLEVHELQATMAQLNSQIEHLSEKESNSSSHSMTLFNELSQLDPGNELGMVIESPENPYPPSMFGEEDEIECDYDDDYLMLATSSPSLSREERRAQRSDRMEEEIVHAYRHLKQICKDIKTHIGDFLDDDLCSEPVSEQSGSLEEVVIELRDLVRDTMDKDNQTRSSHLMELCSLQQRVEELERDLRNCQDSFRKLQEQLHNKDMLLQESSDKMTELSRQVSVRENEVRELSSARDKLQDMLLGDLCLDDALHQTRTERDESFYRRFSLEDELHKARLEVISLNRQLMEAVHQRISMAKQFDQLQVHIGQYVEEEIKKYRHQASVNEYNTTTQECSDSTSHDEYDTFLDVHQNNTTQDTSSHGGYTRSLDGYQNTALNNTNQHNTDINFHGDHNRSFRKNNNNDLNITTQDPIHNRLHGDSHIAATKECNTSENRENNTHSGHYIFSDSQNQQVVSEFDSTPENEDLIFYNDYYGDLNTKNTAPNADSMRYYGHHKSKSESHFDFLSAKRK